ncbi:MAG: S8 family serine peptidase [Thermoanaerobaculia bacterium]|nr:S8 family serine peptidase [Thermoanaerobaculia bacterium]
MPGASEYDDNQTCPGGSSTSFHGTHTSGTMAGDRNNVATPTDPMFLSSDEDGMAPNAQILFQDVGNDTTGCLTGTTGDLALMFQQAHSVGVRVHSNSWGSSTGGAYGSSDQEVDNALWELEDMIIFYSAGNNGPGSNTIGSPGNAKNVVTVGALGSANSTTTASFSSRGPTDDGRLKPDIQAPGTSVLSARGDDNDSTPSCPTPASLSGTSMSTPTVAGGTGLLRQYFVDGFYPTGARTAANTRNPLGSLMKAVLLNGTRNLSNMPSNADGWGRIFLDNNLFFNTGDRRLRVWSRANDVGLTTGQMHTYTVVVPAGAEFRATVAWFDPTAALGAGVQLVNNLDLEVEGPGPTLWRGNVFSGGVSTTGGTADALNTVEQVRLTAPTAGTYTIRVKGTAVPGNSKHGTDRQGYGLAASYANCATAVVAAPTGVSATAMPGSIDVGFTAAGGATVHNVYRADGDCSAPAGTFDFVGTASGTPFSDSLTQGGYVYAYKVRGADGCSEGPLSSCVTATSTQPCTLWPTFDNDEVVARNASVEACHNRLTWSAGTSHCPLGLDVTYNIYRSTTPYFTPGPGNLLVAGWPSTAFEDASAMPHVTYYYVVRAEDGTTVSGGPANGGNESQSSGWVKATAYAASSTAGTFTDGADTPSYLTLEGPWTVTNTQASAGTFSYHNAADGQNYLADTCAAITSPPIVLSSSSAVLSYKARYNLESTWDGVVTEISVNGGPWTDLPPTGGYPSSFSSTGSPPVNACGYLSSHGAFSGSSSGVFSTFSSTLPATAGSTVQIRWRFSSDPASEEAGFFLDEVSITGASVFDSCTAALFVDGFEGNDTSAWTATLP